MTKEKDCYLKQSFNIYAKTKKLEQVRINL